MRCLLDVLFGVIIVRVGVSFFCVDEIGEVVCLGDIW